MLSAPRRVLALPARLSRPLLVAFLTWTGATCTETYPTAPQVQRDPVAAVAGDVVITPGIDTILVGELGTLTASNVNSAKGVAWSSSDTSVATIAGTGSTTARVTGRAPGQVTITAASGNKSGTSLVIVRPVPVRAVTVAPDQGSLQRGDSLQFTATARDSAGTPLTGRPITWSVVDTGLASVSATGGVVARARGVTQVRATSEGVSGGATLTIRVPQLTVASVGTAGVANAGDTLVIGYTVQNLWDSADADSVVMRVGLRNATGAMRAARRALPRIGAGLASSDTARLVVPAGTPPGSYTVVVHADCRDVSGATDETRLDACLAAPATAGSIDEGIETDNSRTAPVVVRGAELAAAALAAPDTVLTRTSFTATLTVLNAGSATGTGFDVVFGLRDENASRYVAAAAVTTPAIGSRESRVVSGVIAVPAAMDATHRYAVHAFADCRNTGATAIERLEGCQAAPAAAGDVAEGDESDNLAVRAAALRSNVVRVVAQPDSLAFTAIGDSVVLTVTAYDQGNAVVPDAGTTVTSFNPAVVSASGPTLRAVAPGSAFVVVVADGAADTVVAAVAPQVARVTATPDSVALGAIGDTAQLSASATDRNGHPVAATTSWASLDPEVATVSAGGLVRASGNGSARVVASSGAVADTVIVRVSQDVETLVVAPDSAIMDALGDSAAFVPSARDRNGNLVAGASISWSTLDPSVVSVTGAGQVIALANGRARVAARSAGAADTVVAVVRQRVTTLHIVPDSAVLTTLGDSAMMSATARDRRGSVVDDAVVGWNSLDPAVATVDGSGVVRAAANGSARITASVAGVADTVVVQVAQQAAALVASPDSATLVALGDTVRLTATVLDAAGRPIPGAPVSWSALDTAIAAVDANGRVTALGNGRGMVVASSGPVADTVLVVVQQVVTGMVVAPELVQLGALGDTARLYASPTDARGALVRGAGVAWGTLDPGVATVDGSGLVTAVANGTARVVAASGPAADTAVVLVAQRVASIVASPDSLSFRAIGDSGVLTASVRDASGNPIAEAPVSWSSLDTTIADVTVAGRVTALGRGRARIVAESGGAADTVSAIVAQEVASVAIAPDSVLMTVLRDTVRLRASAADRNGYPVAGAPIAWRSLDGTIANIIDADGLLMGYEPGRARIVATSGAAADTITVTIERRVADVVVHADTSVILQGTTEQKWAEVLDAAGQPMPSTLTWASLDPAIATVSGSGLVTGVAPGRALIVVTSTPDLHADTAVAYVNPPGVGSQWIGTTPDGWSSAANWYPHVVPQQPDRHVYIAAGTPYRPWLSGYALAGKVVVAPGTSLDLRGFTLIANGDVTAAGPIDSGTVELRAAATVSGSLPQLSVKAPVTLAGRTLVVAASVEGGGRLTLGGHRLDAQSVRTYDGTLVMDNAADTIRTGEVNFYGAHQLSAGTLMVDRYFSAGSGPAFSWDVSGGHTTVLDGSWEQAIQAPSDTNVALFQNLEVRNRAGVVLQGMHTVRGRLRLSGGGVLSAPMGLKLLSELPDVADGSYGVDRTVIAGNVVATRNVALGNGGLDVDGGGSLTLNGHTIQAFGISTHDGTLTMNHPADTLSVQVASFYGRHDLSAGTMQVSGSESISPYQFVNGRWNVSGSFRTVYAGTMPQQVSASDTTIDLMHVDVLNPQGVSFTSTMNVRGRMRVLGGGKVSAVGNGGPARLKFWSALPEVVDGTYDLDNTTVAGAVTALADFRTTGMLNVEGGQLTLGGHTVDAATFGTNDGGLTMANPADSLIVRQNAYFYGGASALSAGTMILKGGLSVARGSSTGSFVATGSHTTVFDGATWSEIGSDTTLDVRFANVRVSAPAEVTLRSDIHVYGQMTVDAGAALRKGYDNIKVYYHRLLPDVRGQYAVSSAIRDSLALGGDASLPEGADLWIEDNGTLDLNGHRLAVDYLNMWSNARLMMPAAAAETLTVRRNAYLGGQLDFRGGVVAAGGNVSFVGSPAWPVGGSRTKFLFTGAVPHDLQGSYSDTLVMHDVEVVAGATLAPQTPLRIDGLLTLQPGATYTAQELTVGRRLPIADQATLNVQSLSIAGDVVADGDRRYTTMGMRTMIQPNARLRLNGHTLELPSQLAVTGGTMQPGTLVMDTGADTLVVNGGASFGGATLLTAGTLVLRGDLEQWYDVPEAFIAGAAHVTRMAGTAPQRVRIPSATSHLGSLQVEGDLTLEDNTTLTGRLMAQGGTLHGGGHTLEVRGGLAVNGLVVDAAPISVTGGPLVRFDDVTFQSAGGPTPLMLRGVSPKFAGDTVFTMHNISFLGAASPPYGYWLDVADFAVPALALDVVSPQAADGPEFTNASNVVVSWRAPLGAAGRRSSGK